MQVQVTVMASYCIISLGKKFIHNCFCMLSTWLLTGVAKAPTVTKFISHWGPGGTLGAHTTVGVAVGASVSTLPGSRRLLSTTHAPA